MQVLLEKSMEDHLLTAFAFIVDVKQPFISAAAVCGLQKAVVVPVIEF